MEEHRCQGCRIGLHNTAECSALKPSKWNSKDKGTYIGLTRGNLRVIYKGPGKTPRDASAVRADRPILPSCGLFYFEVTVVSKGREGYIAVGLSTKQSSLSKLPGSEKTSVGYHGNDGHLYANNAKKYGPIYDTGDVIGCCVNMITRSCFFTYNGVKLGEAVQDLPKEVYPTVGLNSTNETVDVNFGQKKFLYDINNFLELKKKEICAQVRAFPFEHSVIEWQHCMDRMVLSYLVHHGYLETARQLARKTEQTLEEPEESIRNRQAIQQLVLAGEISSAVKTVNELYPNLFDRYKGLLLNLHCRQFIEMIAGVDDGLAGNVYTSSLVGTQSPSIDTSSLSCNTTTDDGSRMTGQAPPPHSSPVVSQSCSPAPDADQSDVVSVTPSNCHPNREQNNWMNGFIVPVKRSAQVLEDIDIDLNENDVLSTSDVMSMAVPMEIEENLSTGSGAVSDRSSPEFLQVNDSCSEATTHVPPLPPSSSDVSAERKCYLSSTDKVERLLKFGMQLKAEHQQLSEHNVLGVATVKNLMEEAFSLIAYADPWSSPAARLLDPLQREGVCSELNAAILNYQNLVPESSLELTAAHANLCLRTMAAAGLPASSFVTLQDICLS